jgi:hypothetical protein
MKLIVSVPNIEAKGGGKELRLLWAWSDQGSAVVPPPSPNVPTARTWIGSKGQPQDHNLGSGVVVGQSSTFYGIKDGFPVGLSGNGIPVYGPRNPMGAVALYLAVYEIDKEYDSLAEEVEKARQMQGAAQLVAALASTAFGPLVGVIDAIPAILRQRGKPDLFAQIQHSGFEQNLYAVPNKPEGSQYNEKSFNFEKVSVTVRFELYPDDNITEGA